MPATISSFVDGVLQSGLLDPEKLLELQRLQDNFHDVRLLAHEALRRDWLTAFQANQVLQGKGTGLTLGPFVLLQRLGEGGMGQVFKARQKVLDRVVALKVIRKQSLKNPKVIQRFLREIRAAGQLNHPHIVRAYDADQIDGIYYISMEYIEGIDLYKLVKDNGPLPVDQACEYIRQAALGLQHAFERGMVHRDIKPANLLMTRAIATDRRRSSGLIPRPLNLPPLVREPVGRTDIKRTASAVPRLDSVQQYPWGMIKILDMGLARCTDPFTGRAATHLTHIGSVVGTPEYIAPEQARDSHSSDIRADLYSLGCTLYFLLSGRPPFPTGTLTEKLLQHQLDEPQSVVEARRENLLAEEGFAPPTKAMLHVPASVLDLLERLLAKRPEDRPHTPIALAHELQTIVKHITDGTLPKEPPAENGTPIFADPLIVDVELTESTREMAPLVQLPSKPAQTHQLAGKLVVALASISGLAIVTVLTVIAALVSRGTRTQASVVDPEPIVKPASSEEPVWKRAPKDPRVR